MIAHLTNAVPAHYAQDISNITITMLQIGGLLGVAVFGTLYLAWHEGSGESVAPQDFTITVFAMSGTALIATTSIYLATHRVWARQTAEC